MNPCVAILLILAALTGSTMSAAETRQRLRFDADWRFQIDDRDLVQPVDSVAVEQWRWRMTPPVKRDDVDVQVAPTEAEIVGSEWQNITVPTKDVFKRTAGFAWFHAVLPVLERRSGTIPTLRFHCVDDNATVFFNGRELLRHQGSEESFDVALDPAAWRSDSPNVLTLLVENHRREGGILKPVVLWQAPSVIPTPTSALPDFNDSAWRTVHLPHDYVVEGTFSPEAVFGHGFLPTPKAWYRRTFQAPTEWQGKSVWVDFDGIFSDATIWLNGKPLGAIRSGYIGKRFDLAGRLNFGGVNTLAVHVDPSKFEGWWYEGGGIYRQVWLTVADPLHLEPESLFVRSTVHDVTGPQPSADLRIQASIVNEGTASEPCTVEVQVIAPDQRIVATTITPVQTLDKHTTTDLTLAVAVPKALLWSLELPQLYRLEATVRRAGVAVDQETVTFGIRTLRSDPQRGFFLNEKPVKIKGVCNHQDFAGIGNAVSDGLQEWRVRKLLAMGCNAWRTAHNPVNPGVLDACDRLGMLVFDETRHFGDTYSLKSSPTTPCDDLADLTRMIRRDRNHPSVVYWSISNEEQTVERTPGGARIAQAMHARILTLDDSRPITAAVISGISDGQVSGITDHLDVEGMNYKLGPYMDDFHKRLPQKPMVGSEAVSNRCARGFSSTTALPSNPSFFGDQTRGLVSGLGLSIDKKSGRLQHLPSVYWKPVAERPFAAGLFVWTGFDYRGEPSPFKWPDINSNFGILDMCGFPKDDYFYYRAWWQSQPSLHVAPHWNWPANHGPMQVLCHGNTERVELLLNGRSLGIKSMPRYEYLTWEVVYEPGRLEARGFNGTQQVVSDVVETVGAAVGLRLTADDLELLADHEDQVPVEVRIVDAAGRVVSTGDNEVEFTISGPGIVAGVGNGDPTCHEPDKASRRSAFNGHCLAVVQATGKAGEITLTATAKGLPPAQLKISSRPAQVASVR